MCSCGCQPRGARAILVRHAEVREALSDVGRHGVDLTVRPLAGPVDRPFRKDVTELVEQNHGAE